MKTTAQKPSNSPVPASTEREQINYNKVVNYDEETNEITMLDYVFHHGDGFKGAVGSRFEPISKYDYDTTIEHDNVVDYLVESGIEMTSEQKRKGWEGVAEQMTEDEKAGLLYDLSYRDRWEELREECGFDDNEAYVFNCIGGGRCFDKKFTGNKNKQLTKIIRQYES